MTNNTVNQVKISTFKSKEVSNEDAYFSVRPGDLIQYDGHSDGGLQRVVDKLLIINVDTGKAWVQISSVDVPQ